MGAFILDRTAPVLGFAPFDVVAMNNYAAMVGGNPAIILWYDKWPTGSGQGTDFPATQLDNVVAVGAEPMVTWEACGVTKGVCDAGGDAGPSAQFTDRNISAGMFDAYIHSWAVAAKAWGKPLYLRPLHEMNGTWYPWSTGATNPNGNTPADYVAAWKHLHQIFDAVGAPNVRWVWSPNVSAAGWTPLASDYPGDAWVDWVGLDGYNWGSTTAMTTWMSFEDLFAASYDEIRAVTHKPLMFAEVACAPESGDKAAWITQGFLVDLPARFPAVRAVVWYDNAKETDWRVNSSAESLSAWQGVVKAPRFRGKLSALGP